MRIICAPIYSLMQVRWHIECLNSRNDSVQVPDLQIMIREITNLQAESQCYVNIFIILVRLLYQKINNVDMLLFYMS